MDTLSYKTLSAKPQDQEKKWYIVDAQDAVVGRIVSRIAPIIRGKHKPGFSPHIDCGDRVIVINADKVRFTGKKWDDKEYIWHTGHPGGQRSKTPRQVKEKSASIIIEKAVKGMLPKNKLGRKQFQNLYVYNGEQHPHEAQQPKELKLDY